MAYIELSGKIGKGHRTLVDEETYNKYNHLSWYLGDTGYAMRRSDILDDGTKVTQRLHRLITNATEGMVVDHLNGNRLDNRKSNLRICTQADNNRNRKDTKGICYDKSKHKWMVRYRNKFYGRYTTELEAKKAYRLACSGVEYTKKRRSQYMLPNNITKQYGKYNVSIQRNGIRKRKNGIPTLVEAIEKLNELKKEG